MTLFEWDDSFSTHITQVDEQHQQLVSLINELDESLQNGTGGLIISYVIQELIRYVGVHFEYEEHLMMSHGFPGLTSHRQEHDFYVMKLKNIQDKFTDGDALSKNTLDFLKEWISCHIKGTDQIYAGFIQHTSATQESH